MLMGHIRRDDYKNREKEVNKVKRHLAYTERNRGGKRKRARDSCWIINNACFIQNQLGLSTQNTFCIMKSLASSLVQQQRYARPKNLANYRPAEPSHNMKDWGVQYSGLQTWRAFLRHPWQDMRIYSALTLK